MELNEVIEDIAKTLGVTDGNLILEWTIDPTSNYGFMLAPELKDAETPVLFANFFMKGGKVKSEDVQTFMHAVEARQAELQARKI